MNKHQVAKKVVCLFSSYLIIIKENNDKNANPE